MDNRSMRLSACRCVCLLTIAFLASCGDDASVTPTDGGDAGDADAIPWDGSNPEPALPAITPCRSGWQEIELGRLSVRSCVPYEPGVGMASDVAMPRSFIVAPTECPFGSFRFTGEPACTPIGEACPVGEWPATAADYYVRAGSTGAGTQADPLGTVAEAIAAASAGDTIAVGQGRYEEKLTIDRALTILGTCVERVAIMLPSGETGPTVLVAVPGVVFRDLAVHGFLQLPGHDAIAVEGGTLELEGVLTDLVRVTGSGRLTAETVVFHFDSSVATTVATPRYALGLSGASQAEVTRAGFWYGDADRVFAQTMFNTLLVSEGSSLVLRDAFLNGVGHAVRAGLVVSGGSRAELEGVYMPNAKTSVPTRVTGEGSELVIRESFIAPYIVEDIESAPLAVLEGARATVERSTFTHGRQALIVNQGSHLEVRDSVLFSTSGLSRDIGGYGILNRAFRLPQTVELERVLIEATRDIGLVAFGPTTLTGTDISVLDTRARGCTVVPCVDFPAGIGLGVYSEGRASLQRFRIAGSLLVGAQIARDGLLELDQGFVEDNVIGVNVQVDNYDLNTLTSRVIYRNNRDGNFAARNLPVPGL